MDDAPGYVASRTCTVVDEREPQRDGGRQAPLTDYADTAAYVLIADRDRGAVIEDCCGEIPGTSDSCRSCLGPSRRGWPVGVAPRLDVAAGTVDMVVVGAGPLRAKAVLWP